jgi:hypothetical protein
MKSDENGKDCSKMNIGFDKIHLKHNGKLYMRMASKSSHNEWIQSQRINPTVNSVYYSNHVTISKTAVDDFEEEPHFHEEYFNRKKTLLLLLISELINDLQSFNTVSAAITPAKNVSVYIKQFLNQNNVSLHLRDLLQVIKPNCPM